MSTEAQFDTTGYRLIITRRKASEILLSGEPFGASLPQVEVRSSARLTEQLIARVRQDYHLETYCLMGKEASASSEIPSPARYAVLEALDSDDEAPRSTAWIPFRACLSSETLPPADRLAISRSLEKLEGYTSDPARGPFARPGWIEELFGWLEEVIRPFGLRATGKFEQRNAGPTFSLLRIETNRGAVWFKATGEPNARELPISVALDRLFPNSVPSILAVHPNWNAWLCEEAPGETLDNFRSVGTWAFAATSLAKLQIASVPRSDLLVEAGCQDLRFQQLEARIEPFLRHTSDLMSLQAKEPPKVLRDVEVLFLGDCLKAAFSELAKHEMPSTLGHLDCNPGNILVSPCACRFLDWAEASVTHPFFTFAYFLEHARRNLAGPDVPDDALASAYLRPWQSFFSRETLAQALAYSPLLAVFTYAVASKKWASPEAIQNRALGGFFRSLARRAYREAAHISTRRELCRI
jgi:hypothetical protein